MCVSKHSVCVCVLKLEIRFSKFNNYLTRVSVTIQIDKRVLLLIECLDNVNIIKNSLELRV